MNNKVAFEIDNDNVSYDDFYAAAGKIKKALERHRKQLQWQQRIR